MLRTGVRLAWGLSTALAALGLGLPASAPASAIPIARPANAQAAAGAKAAGEAEAARLLSVLPLPPGASALGGEPPEANATLSGPTAPSFISDLVGPTAWWSVPTTPRAAIQYVHDHLPEVSPFSASIFPTAIQPGVLRARIRLLEGTGAIGERWLVLTSTSLPSGASALRVDAQVLWVRPRDPIPVRVRYLRVGITRRSGGAPIRTFAVTSRRRVTAAVELINSLLPARPSLLPTPCPAPKGTIALVFLSSRHARAPLARATVTIGGCGGVQLAIKGDPPQPLLRGPAGGLVAPLEHALGRHRLPPLRAG